MQKTIRIIDNALLFHGCLHFRYNGKKYLYGISQQLITCGEQNGLLKKLNGTYQHSEKQKKQKSLLLLKKQKTLLKIEYIILPKAACQNGFLWHVYGLGEKLLCRNILLLENEKNEVKYEDALYKLNLKQKIKRFILNHNQSTTQQQFTVSFFKQHPNYKKPQKSLQKSSLIIAQNKSSFNQSNQLKQNNQSSSSSQQIYQSTLNNLILELLKKQINQYLQSSMFKQIGMSTIHREMEDKINLIRNNNTNCKNEELKLTEKQIKDIDLELQNLIVEVSTSEKIIFPTGGQQIEIIFLPNTAMVTLLHQHSIMLINPCNLAGCRLHLLGLPIEKVGYILLTKFSMAFIQFLITWGILGKQKKINYFLTICTLDFIYQKIKTSLKQSFLWTDQMIRSKIAFRIIPTSIRQNKRIQHIKVEQYPLGFLKLSYIQQKLQDYWVFKFGNKQFCYLNQMIVYEQQLKTQNYEYIIFDMIKQQLKQSLYSQATKSKTPNQPSSQHSSISKLIYNRSTLLKYQNKYFYQINHQNPIIRLESQIKIQQTFFPYFLNKSQKQRYKKIKLNSGQSINCLNRNVVVVEGMVMVLWDQYEMKKEFKNGRQIKSTKVVTRSRIVIPSNTIKNGYLEQNLTCNKLKNIKELICLKNSIILLEQQENQDFYQNKLIKNYTKQLQLQLQKERNKKTNQQNQKKQNKNTTKKQDKQAEGNKMNKDQTKNSSYFAGMIKKPLKNAQFIPSSQLQIMKLQSNSLIKYISKSFNNFSYACQYLSNTKNHSPQSLQNTDFVQINSPLYLLNSLFTKKAFDSGQIINKDNKKAYFIVKGSMRWNTMEENEPKANNNSFIGNMLLYYQGKILEENWQMENSEGNNEETFAIEVIKDTWTLEVDINEFHNKFLVKYPEIAYFMVSKGKIFY